MNPNWEELEENTCDGGKDPVRYKIMVDVGKLLKLIKTLFFRRKV